MTIQNLPKELQDNILNNDPNGPSNIDDVSTSIGEIESFGDRSSIREMYTDINNYRKMLKERITFVNPSLTAAIPFTRENLYLICAYSGWGKSTIAANISYPMWQEQKKVLVISNEESKHDVLLRIACLHLGYNFNDYKKNTMPIALLNAASKLFPEIAKYVKVVDINHKGGMTTKKEGVINLLEAVRGSDYKAVLIDYYQLIKFSVEDRQASTYNVLNDLRIYFGQYIKNSEIPIAIFGQLHSMGKRNNKDLDSRIKHCPDIYEPSTVVLEVIPDFKNKTSNFIIHKDRFGYTGKEVTCAYDNGRFVDCDEAYLTALEEKKLDELEGKEEEESTDGST